MNSNIPTRDQPIPANVLQADRLALREHPEYSLSQESKAWLREHMPWAWLDRRNKAVITHAPIVTNKNTL